MERTCVQRDRQNFIQQINPKLLSDDDWQMDSLNERRQPPSEEPVVGSSAASFKAYEGLCRQSGLTLLSKARLLYTDDWEILYFQLLVVRIFLSKSPGKRTIRQAGRFLKEYLDPEPLSRRLMKICSLLFFFFSFGKCSSFRRANCLVDLAKERLWKAPTAGVVRPKTFQVGASTGIRGSPPERSWETC